MLENYAYAKRALSDLTGASEDLLHIHAGLLIFVFFALVLKRRMRSKRPIISVYLFAVGNEVVDNYNHDPWIAVTGLMDILNTVFWPSVLFLIARRGRDVGEHVEQEGDVGDEEDETPHTTH